MNTLLVSNGYPNKKNKGLGIFVLDQAKALKQIGCNVVIAAVDIRSIRKWRKWGVERLTIDTVDYYVINIPGFGGKMPWVLMNMLNTLGLYVLIKVIAKDGWKPDIAHGHFTSIGYAVTKLKKYLKCPVVITEHSSLLLKSKYSKGLDRTAANVYKQADALISVSPVLKELILNKYNITSIVIPNIVDVTNFSYNPMKSSSEYHFISVGNLIPRKRMDLTIEAFSNEFKNEDNIFLTILGKGPETARLESLIMRLGMKNRIRLMGEKGRNDIASELNESNCFVLASQSETFGVVYIEALACGVPIIATKCGGPEHFVDQSNGVLVDVDDTVSLRKAMRFMYENSHSFDSEEISKKTRNRFSPRTIAEELLFVYVDIKVNAK